MEWVRLLKMIRWLVSTILLAVLWPVASKLIDLLTKPEPVIVQWLAFAGLVAGGVGWLYVTYKLGRIVKEFE